MHTIREDATVGDVVNEMPRINVALDNRHADHQTYMVEIEGMLKIKPISILIDPDSSLSYVSPSIEKRCNFHLNKFENSWMVQLATGTKRKVVIYVED